MLPKSIEAELRSHIFLKPSLSWKGNVRFNTLLTYEVQGAITAFLRTESALATVPWRRKLSGACRLFPERWMQSPPF